MTVLAARIIAGAWRELGAGYRPPTVSTGREGIVPSFAQHPSRPVVFESGAR